MSVPIKYELLKRLSDAKGKPVSGQQLADDLNLSRTAIWKHMKQLEEEGYQFESIRKKGYILISTP
ncbi:MAG TPA: bifunctional biotin--[acetyl-CoA-carboxylase] synthetase/biotin operon repressor, partial [Paenibacillaceae bacterium]|nr:bifunctional biotin--[acetyl-CoA-carboxylase] synthetase/biotin operon repressor [Paenibacillaceae bacterium]